MWQPIVWEYLKLYTLPYLGWLNNYLVFESQNRDNIVGQAWQLNIILPIATMPGPNFGYYR